MEAICVFHSVSEESQADCKDKGVYVKDVNGDLTGVVEETARLKMVEMAFDLSLFRKQMKKVASPWEPKAPEVYSNRLLWSGFLLWFSFLGSTNYSEAKSWPPIAWSSTT